MIRDDETGWIEPTITINGRELSFAQAMTLRVAVGHFGMFLADGNIRRSIGDRLAEGYQANLAEIERSMRSET